MLRRIHLALALAVALVSYVLSSAPASAGWGHGWGHHGWGHHHHHHHVGIGIGYGGLGYGGLGYGGLGYGGLGYGGLGYGGLYNNWGYPSYGVGRYTSLSIGFPSYYPSYVSSYGMGSSWGIGGFGLRGYRSYYAPRVLSYSVSLPSYYVAPPTYYYAPATYPSYSLPCDSCSNYPACTSDAVGYPASGVVPGVYAPSYSNDSYSTGIAPLPTSTSSWLAGTAVPSASMTAGGSMVDRMLGRASLVGNALPNEHRLASSRPVDNALPSGTSLASRSASGVQRVSTAKPIVAPDISTSMLSSKVTPLPARLLEAADAIFAAGGYSQAAAATAHKPQLFSN
jgi:hypothetical protein